MYTISYIYIKAMSLPTINNLISSDLGNVCPKCTSCRAILEIK